jgi:predicted nuclease of predicted toxin-antitoxin system
MTSKTFDEWEREQRASNPRWDAEIREIERLRGPRRKVPLLLDANLEEELVDGLNGVRDFRISVAGPREGDEAIWNHARREGRIIVTADEDFWNDRRFPLRDSPGVILLTGRTSEQKAYAFAVAVVHYQLIEWWRKLPGWTIAMKIRASSMGTTAKWREGGTTITHETKVRRPGSARRRG